MTLDATDAVVLAIIAILLVLCYRAFLRKPSPTAPKYVSKADMDALWYDMRGRIMDLERRDFEPIEWKALKRGMEVLVYDKDADRPWHATVKSVKDGVIHFDNPHGFDASRAFNTASYWVKVKPAKPKKA